MNPNNWEERIKQFKAGLDADQAEVQALLAGSSSIDAGIEDESIAGVVDDELIEHGNSWEERQVVLERMSGSIADEIARRISIMGKAYPFSFTKWGGLNYHPSKTGVYEFCLAAARNPTGEKEGFPKASAIFEMIARDALAAHLGQGTNSLRVGAPAYDFESRGHSARETFMALEATCGEFHWHPEPGFPQEPAFKDLKDAGIDLVVWKPCLDGRNGHLFVLGQCACGKNDVDANKGRQLSLERLRIWLRPVCHSTPIRSFFVAHHIPNTIELYEISKDSGVVFDRARIAIVAETYPERMWSREGIDYRKAAMIYSSPEVAQPVLAQPRRIKAVGQRSRSRESAPPPT